MNFWKVLREIVPYEFLLPFGSAECINIFLECADRDFARCDKYMVLMMVLQINVVHYQWSTNNLVLYTVRNVLGNDI